VSDFDEKTRVTAIQPLPSANDKKGNDCLVVIYTKDSSLLGKRYVLERSPTRVGRGADNQIVLDGDSVSRRHAHWERRGVQWWVIDDGSTNGTYVNDELVDKQQALTNGDRVKVGGLIFKFLAGEDVESQYHEEIYRMTIVDGLVQIFNKRYLYEALEREMIRARRHERELCVVMFDIDHFKLINDQYGHLAGDYVLKELARVVQGRIRRDEVFARYGGEEFALVLPETNLAGAGALCEEIRKKVAEHRFIFQNEVMPLTISLGAALIAEEDRNASDLIRRADEKLYEAKRGGRNRVCTLPNAQKAGSVGDWMIIR
jgi:two-component system, cell cycle response regulator